MPNDFEKLTASLISGQSGQRAMQSMNKISSILNTENGREFLRLLAGGGGDAIKSAAAGIGPSDRDALGKMMNSLMSTTDGVALLTRLISMLRGG